jgi:uncharacterized membrane protein
MEGSKTAFYLTIALCIVCVVITVSLFGVLLPKDNSQNSKILISVTVFSFFTSVLAYCLALWHFSSNPNQMIQFTLGLTMLVILPASLTSAAVSTITISNLRDTLAAASQ